MDEIGNGPGSGPYSDELDWPDGVVPMKFLDDDGSMAEPFEQYAFLREHAPVARLRTAGEDVWMITRYEDVRKASREPKTFCSHAGGGAAPRFTFLPQFDGPEHRRLRHAYAQAFNPKSVALVENTIRMRAETLLDDFIEAGGGDIVEQFAVPLTMYTISGIMEVPIEDVDKMKEWSDEALAVHAAGRGLPGSPTAEQSAAEFFAYIEKLLETLYANNSASVGGHLARLWKEGELSAKEAREMTGFLFVAGHDTTTHQIGNSVRQLVAQPELLARIRDEPADAAKFVEEIVRFQASVHRMSRRTSQDVTVGGATIPEGSFVRLVIASANRDETAFDHPDDFDIDRDNSRHFGFGHGVHTCIGMPLARLETRIAVEVLAKKLGSIEFAGDQPVELMPGHMVTLGARHVIVKVTAAATDG